MIEKHKAKPRPGCRKILTALHAYTPEQVVAKLAEGERSVRVDGKHACFTLWVTDSHVLRGVLEDNNYARQIGAAFRSRHGAPYNTQQTFKELREWLEAKWNLLGW